MPSNIWFGSFTIFNLFEHIQARFFIAELFPCTIDNENINPITKPKENSKIILYEYKDEEK